MDLVGPLPRTKFNNRHTLVVMDYTTRWPEAFPLSTTESRAIADELLVLFTRVGVTNERSNRLWGKLFEKTDEG